MSSRFRKLLSGELGRISADEYQDREPSGLVVVLDNIRSAFNVGSIFRTCDAFGVDKVFLCGICAEPPSAQIHKTALGAETSVPSQHFDSTLEAVDSLKKEGYVLVGIEQVESSISLEKFSPEPGKRYAFIFGNEVEGVSQDVIDRCDFCLEIPQYGCKHSLNVSVSAGAVLWQTISHK